MQISDANFVVSDNDGVTRLLGVADASFIIDGDDTINSGGSQRIGCSDVVANERILCSAFSELGATTNFLLPYFNNNQSFGDFEFCTEDVSSTDCITELLNTPDGNVLVRTNGAPAALAARNTGNTVVLTETDQLNYMKYEEQASESLTQFDGRSRKQSLDMETARNDIFKDIASQ
ncbi:MAG: hypothetical protein AB8B64_07350 [Granulosicoccus sp.]